MRNTSLRSILIISGLAIGYFANQVLPIAVADDDTGISTQDRELIFDLISQYSHAWDGKDSESWVALFADVAVNQTYLAGRLVNESLTNSERLAGAQSRHSMFVENGIQTRHFQTNTLLSPLEDGSITGITVFSVSWQYDGEKAPIQMHTGLYNDRFVKTSSGWKFARREVRVDHE